MACPTESVVLEFLDGRLADDAIGALEEHLDGCGTCAALLAELGRSSTGGGSAKPSGPTFDANDFIADRYRIIRFIARGGMGEVYEAEDTALGARVALKPISMLHTGDDPGAQAIAVERMRREVRLARLVTHPNVCRVFDLGVHRGWYFLTMELLEGETLAQRLRRGKLGIAEALPIVEQLANGLDAAHAAGIVHRDFKSDNVILLRSPSSEGVRAVITDFGLARAPGDPSLSVENLLVGTLGYLAPEQLAGSDATVRSDLYAFGVVVYEMVTGALPHGRSVQLKTALARSRTAVPSPRARVADLDPKWEQAILSCLAETPGERPASARAFLAQLLGERVRRRRSWTAALITVPLLAVVVALVAWLAPHALRRSSPEGARLHSVAVLGFQNNAGPELAWLSAALSEMLRAELHVESGVRVSSGESIGRVRRELQLGDAAAPLDAERLRTLSRELGCDRLLSGSYGGSGGRLTVELALEDATSGKPVAKFHEEGQPDELLSMVSRLGHQLRKSLGVAKPSPAVAAQLKASTPESARAARLYAEGLEHAWDGEHSLARESLSQAVALEPGFALGHSALAEALGQLGRDREARAEAQKALDGAAPLGREQQLLIEARYRLLRREWPRAIELFVALHEFSPDRLDYGLSLAAAERLAARFEDSFATLDALRKLLPLTGGSPQIDLEETETAAEQGDMPRMIAAAERVVDKSEANGEHLLAAYGRLKLGYGRANQGHQDQALALIAQARSELAAAHDRRGEASALHALSDVYYRLAKYDEMQKSAEQSLAICRELGDRRAEASNLNYLATSYYNRNQNDRALALYRQALGIARETGNRVTEEITLSNLAGVFMSTHKFADALEALEQAIAISREIGDAVGERYERDVLAETYYRQGKLAEARREEALVVASDHARHDVMAEAQGLARLGKLERVRGDFAASRVALEGSIAGAKKSHYAYVEFDARRHLAELEECEGHAATAVTVADEAAAGFREQKDKESEAIALFVKVRALLALGNLDEARRTFGVARALDPGAAQSFASRIVSARLDGAEGRRADAREALAAVAAEATAAAELEQAFEARLARAALAPRSSAAAELKALGDEASRLGFGGIALRAARLAHAH